MLVSRTIVLPAGLESVWSVLTDDRRMSQWFGAEVAIERGAGSAGPQEERGAGSAGPQEERGPGSAGPQTTQSLLRSGSRVTFTWSDGRRRAAVVEAHDPQRLLVLRWLPFEQDAEGLTRPCDPSTMRFVLDPHVDGTRLRVTEEAPEHLDPRAQLLAGTSVR